MVTSPKLTTLVKGAINEIKGALLGVDALGDFRTFARSFTFEDFSQGEIYLSHERFIMRCLQLGFVGDISQIEQAYAALSDRDQGLITRDTFKRGLLMNDVKKQGGNHLDCRCSYNLTKKIYEHQDCQDDYYLDERRYCHKRMGLHCHWERPVEEEELEGGY
eukprot:gnl/TRDRNA2_/TRDRNA2_205487_c0_seq1.p1 gnl/TRDRNA2_/TRDRNA2_205487_c0~~gnl/TRDRNA2_/TRDRNA2_205487_c0_seq1.p1  ORF type:complete len:172 (-),score=30.96 gnl/TRDRNA2_/TRDRNA2_205487_c0_seq1:102-587(-)